MELSKSIKVNCSFNELASFYHRQAFSIGNNGLAKKLGIHPSTSSRDKNRIFDLACLMVTEMGLPPDSVNVSDEPAKVVIVGDSAEKLIQILAGKGKVKRKAPAVTEAQDQISGSCGGR